MKKHFTLKEIAVLAKEFNINTSVVSLKTLQTGMSIELEHSNITKGDPKLTMKIVLAHLRESPKYYEGLVKMERTLPKSKSIIKK